MDQYIEFVGKECIQEIKRRTKKLKNNHIVMFNSTSNGGGVAEILNSMVVLFNKMGLKVGWRVIKGTDDFFNVTKKFHNGLQGENVRLSNNKKAIYESTNEFNALMTHIDHDLVIVHDPQPLPLIDHYKKHNKNKTWVWRCHVDLSRPNKQLWNYLKQWISQYDEIIVSMDSYKQSDLTSPQNIIIPSIDPLSTKNKNFSKNKLIKKLQQEGINTKKPFIAQVSRFDKWKDPIGVIDAFKKIKEKHDIQLVLLGNIATDDPEGPLLYHKIMKIANGEKDIHIINKNDELLVNAVQSLAEVVIQNSKKEGFGLTVTEALWKGTPVLAKNVGGITSQVIDGITGYVVKDQKDLINKLDKLLSDNKLKKTLGKNAKEHVRKNFLLPRQMKDYLDLFERHLKDA